MNKNNGFTLIELLSVVVILALTFMFVAPKMASLINEGNSKEVRLIEEKALVSAKKYVNSYDTNFLNNFIEVGHTKTVYRQDLIDNGLMTLEEIEQIEDFRGVEVKLLDNDKLEYTISRLSNTKDYTNEELYQIISSLQSSVDSLQTQVTSGNIFLKSYPVGSIYISTSSTNPGSTYGGTWEEYGKGKTLVGVDSNDSDFNTVNKTGGEKTHTLTISEMPSHNHFLNQYHDQTGYGVTIPAKTNYFIFNQGVAWTSTEMTDRNKTTASFSTITSSGGSQAHNNLQPYITVYMWKRTA